MLFTIYTLLGLLIFAFIITQIVFDNTWNKKHIWLMLIFPIHSIIALLVCWASYTVFYYIDLKSRTQNKDK